MPQKLFHYAFDSSNVPANTKWDSKYDKIDPGIEYWWTNNGRAPLMIVTPPQVINTDSPAHLRINNEPRGKLPTKDGSPAQANRKDRHFRVEVRQNVRWKKLDYALHTREVSHFLMHFPSDFKRRSNHESVIFQYHNGKEGPAVSLVLGGNHRQVYGKTLTDRLFFKHLYGEKQSQPSQASSESYKDFYTIVPGETIWIHLDVTPYSQRQGGSPRTHFSWGKLGTDPYSSTGTNWIVKDRVWPNIWNQFDDLYNPNMKVGNYSREDQNASNVDPNYNDNYPTYWDMPYWKHYHIEPNDPDYNKTPDELFEQLKCTTIHPSFGGSSISTDDPTATIKVNTTVGVNDTSIPLIIDSIDIKNNTIVDYGIVHSTSNAPDETDNLIVVGTGNPPLKTSETATEGWFEDTLNYTPVIPNTGGLGMDQAAFWHDATIYTVNSLGHNENTEGTLEYALKVRSGETKKLIFLAVSGVWEDVDQLNNGGYDARTFTVPTFICGATAPNPGFVVRGFWRPNTDNIVFSNFTIFNGKVKSGGSEPDVIGVQKPRDNNNNEVQISNVVMDGMCIMAGIDSGIDFRRPKNCGIYRSMITYTLLNFPGGGTDHNFNSIAQGDGPTGQFTDDDICYRGNFIGNSAQRNPLMRCNGYVGNNFLAYIEKRGIDISTRDGTHNIKVNVVNNSLKTGSNRISDLVRIDNTGNSGWRTASRYSLSGNAKNGNIPSDQRSLIDNHSSTSWSTSPVFTINGLDESIKNDDTIQLVEDYAGPWFWNGSSFEQPSWCSTIISEAKAGNGRYPANTTAIFGSDQPSISSTTRDISALVALDNSTVGANGKYSDLFHTLFTTYYKIG